VPIPVGRDADDGEGSGHLTADPLGAVLGSEIRAPA
jgi:hypothetical protein